MHKLIFIIMLLFPLIITSCCKDASDKISINEKGSEIKKPVLQGQDIQVNRSYVSLEIIDIFTKENENYVLKGKVSNIKENDAYPNLAVKGEEYLFAPAFELNEKKEIVKDSERNLRLLSIPGKNGVIDAEIYFEKMKGWFIRDITTK